jgi:hypothetical protein
MAYIQNRDVRTKDSSDDEHAQIRLSAQRNLNSQRRKTMKPKTMLILSSLPLTFALTACPASTTGGTTGDTTVGTLSATFSNPTGTPSVTLTPFSANAGASKSTDLNSTVIAGKQGNRLLTLNFVPIITANRTCSVKTECGIAMVENGVGVPATTISLTATVGGGKLNVTGTATFKQTSGATFDAQVTGTMPYTP